MQSLAIHIHMINLIASVLETNQFMWGTQLQPILSQRGSNQIRAHLEMGYIHPNESHYQTVVLYNRNPVEIVMHVQSPTLPGVTFRPVYRAILANQTLTQSAQQTCMWRMMNGIIIIIMTSSVYSAVDSATSGALGVYCVLCGCPARPSTE